MQMPYEGVIPGVEVAPKAAAQMRLLIERTWPYIKDEIRRNDGD
jgi:hypothetical protein